MRKKTGIAIEAKDACICAGLTGHDSKCSLPQHPQLMLRHGETFRYDAVQLDELVELKDRCMEGGPTWMTGREDSAIT